MCVSKTRKAQNIDEIQMRNWLKQFRLKGLLIQDLRYTISVKGSEDFIVNIKLS